MHADPHGLPTESESSPAVPASPALDSIDDAVMRQRIHASLFASERAGVWVGRFELLDKLGAGGMGTVWAARDHRLQRDVALKFLRSTREGGVGEHRLFREAQALARLSHPNVVSVFDVGRHEGRVWVAMELIEGLTLHEWGQGLRRDPNQVLEVWLAAGRGLAAIHAAGLVHRDIKPANILRGGEGLVRVVDFGLVRAIGATAAVSTERGNTETGPESEHGEDMVEQLMTRTAQFVGTPAYAAPEQRAGREVDARADQYAYCVSVWEALTGARPGPGHKPEADKLSPRVRAALTRGLAEAPDERFESMAALLEALAPPDRSWVVPSVLGSALVVALGLGLAGTLDRAPTTLPCASAGRAIEDQWNPALANQLRASLAEEPSLAASVEAGVEAWVGSWREVAHSACEAVHVHQLASPQSLDMRGRCLDDQRVELDAVLSFLVDAKSSGEPLAALSLLPEPEDCLRRETDPLAELDEAQLAEHRRLLDQLTSLRARRGGRSVAEARREAAAIYAAAERSELGLLRAEAAYTRGRLALRAGDREQTARWLGEAVDRGEALGLVGLRIDAWLGLADAALYLEVDAGRAEFVWQRAEAIARALPRPHRGAARVELTRGRIHFMHDELDQAALRIDAALAQLEALGLTAASDRIEALRLRAGLAARIGEAEEAERLEGEAKALALRQGLSEHELGTDFVNTGLELLQAGDLEGARAKLDEAIVALEREQPGSRAMAKAHTALSALDDAKGDFASAREHALAADAIIRSRYGADHPGRFEPLNALGVAAYRVGDYEAAVEAYALGLDIAGDQLGVLDLAFAELNLAEAHEALGQYRPAEAALRKSLATLEAELGPDHADLAIGHKGLGAVLLATERPAEAEAELRRALALHARHGQSPVEAADTRWLLARALGALGREAEARTEARLAAERYAALGPESAAREAEVRSWLANRLDR